MNRFNGLTLALQIAAGSLSGAPAPAPAFPPPVTYQTSWGGNSFMNHNAKAWVPDEVRDLCVAADGTVFTAGCAESGGGLAIKDGASRRKHPFAFQVEWTAKWVDDITFALRRNEPAPPPPPPSTQPRQVVV